jgi:hypothetical protein
MDPADRRVTQLPLPELFNAAGPVPATRGDQLDAAAIKDHLRAGGTIVLARLDMPLEWLSGDARFSCWKSELHPRLRNPEHDYIHLEDFPDERAWRATVWHPHDGSDIVVFEEHH